MSAVLDSWIRESAKRVDDKEETKMQVEQKGDEKGPGPEGLVDLLRFQGVKNPLLPPSFPRSLRHAPAAAVTAMLQPEFSICN